jgi:hypothetical protein
MKLFFLSGQTTCALLLGAGLLLRAQAALRTESETAATPAAIEAPRARPVESASPRLRGSERSVVVRRGNHISHKRKGFTHREHGRHARRRGVAIAGRGTRWG